MPSAIVRKWFMSISAKLSYSVLTSYNWFAIISTDISQWLVHFSIVNHQYLYWSWCCSYRNTGTGSLLRRVWWCQTFNDFTPPCEAEVSMLIHKSSKKSCTLDPITARHFAPISRWSCASEFPPPLFYTGYWRFFKYSEWQSTYSKNRDQTMYQVVTYRTLKKCKTSDIPNKYMVDVILCFRFVFNV